MPNTYTPTAVKLPATVTEPVDGEPRTAASMTALTRANANGIKFLEDKVGTFTNHVDVTVTGTWTCPADVNYVEIEAFAGGGGGGAGAAGGNVINKWPIGGSGGGAPQRVTRRVVVVPGTVYDAIIGAGGLGAAPGAAPGQAGATKLQVTGGGAIVFECAGAGPGTSGDQFALYGTATLLGQAIGGGCVQQGGTGHTNLGTAEVWYPATVGQGGDGVDNRCTGRFGADSIEKATGGGSSGAASGTDSSTMKGGGKGGGGAAGPGGAGGDGGSGGNAGNPGGTSGSVAGSNGTSAAANTGGGGGGGGGGGAGGDGGEPGGSGGNGGSGWMRISYPKVP